MVLASRPYQNDALVNHSLPELLTEFGVPVLTADSVPGIENVDLSHSRLDVVTITDARCWRPRSGGTEPESGICPVCKLWMRA